MDNSFLPFNVLNKEWIAGLYARVSTDHEDQQSSKTHQIQFFDDAHCKSFNIKSIYDYYPEENMSGTKTDKRTEFKRLVNDAKEGKINCIIAKSISRFARNQIDTIKTVRELSAIGVRFIFLEQALDTIKDTQMLGLFAWMAEEESRTISKRTRFGGIQSAKEGHFTRSVPPFGYKVENKKLAIIPEEAEIVRKIFALFDSGMGILRIANQLNREGIRTRNGSIFRKSRIVYILHNEAYKGWIVYGKRMNADVTMNKFVRTDKSQWVVTKNAHEAIIDEERFDRIQTLFQDPDLKMSKKAKSKLAGIMKCRECGCAMTKNGGTHKTKKDGSQKYYFYYRCNTKYEHGSEACKTPNIREDHLNVLIESKVLNMKMNIDEINYFKNSGIEMLRKKLSVESDIDEVNNKIEKINEMRSSLTDKYLENKISDDIYQKKEREFLEQINLYVEEKLKVLKLESIIEDFKKGVDEHISTIMKFENIDRADNFLLRKIIDAIYVDGEGNIEIVTKFKRNESDINANFVPSVKPDNTNIINNADGIIDLPSNTITIEIFKNASSSFLKQYKIDSKVLLSKDENLYMVDSIKEMA